MTAARLREILFNRRETGVVQALARPDGGDADAKLAALWKVLVPQSAAEEILAGKLKWLVDRARWPVGFLPHGSLAG